MTWWMMSAKADVDDDVNCLARKARGAREAAETARESHELGAGYTGSTWERVSHFMKPILFLRCRSKKDDFDSGGGNKIGATLVVREVHGRFCRKFDRSMAALEQSDMLDSDDVEQIG